MEKPSIFNIVLKKDKICIIIKFRTMNDKQDIEMNCFSTKQDLMFEGNLFGQLFQMNYRK